MRSTDLFGRIRTPEQFQREVDSLVDAWCERRCLNALRCILNGWPMSQGLTDDWAAIRDALKAVRIYRAEITNTEDESIASALQFAESVLER